MVTRYEIIDNWLCILLLFYDIVWSVAIRSCKKVILIRSLQMHRSDCVSLKRTRAQCFNGRRIRHPRWPPRMCSQAVGHAQSCCQTTVHTTHCNARLWWGFAEHHLNHTSLLVPNWLLVLSAVYILRLVLWDQQKYSEKSENIIGLDSYILNCFSYLNPI